MGQRIDRAALPLSHFKVLLSAWVLPLVTDFLRSASAAPRRRHRHDLAVWTARVLLLDVRVQGWIREVLFLAILAVEVSAPVVIF